MHFCHILVYMGCIENNNQEIAVRYFYMILIENAYLKIPFEKIFYLHPTKPHQNQSNSTQLSSTKPKQIQPNPTTLK